MALPGKHAPMDPVRAVLFDVDGTLYHMGWLRLLMVMHLLRAVLVRPRRTLGEIRILLHYRRAQEWLRKHRAAGLGHDAQLERACQTAAVPTERIRACVAYWMEQVPLRYLWLCRRRGLLRRMDRWHKLGIPMAAYSDYPAGEKLRHLGLEQILSFVICSTDADVGSYKPHTRGFEVAAARLGLPARCIAYVGDRADVDARGAQQAGMHAVLTGKAWAWPGRRKDLGRIHELDRRLQNL